MNHQFSVYLVFNNNEIVKKLIFFQLFSQPRQTPTLCATLRSVRTNAICVQAPASARRKTCPSTNVKDTIWRVPPQHLRTNRLATKTKSRRLPNHKARNNMIISPFRNEYISLPLWLTPVGPSKGFFCGPQLLRYNSP